MFTLYSRSKSASEVDSAVPICDTPALFTRISIRSSPANNAPTCCWSETSATPRPGLPPFSFDFLYYLVSLPLIDIHDGDLRPLPGQQQRHRPADPASGPGHHCMFLL